MANISAIKLPDGNTYDIKDSNSGYITGMTILSYGSSTWDDFIEAYNANKVVYCRASSNANPASGSQTRLAFMAYVNNATTPTNVEFQYYRSVSTHTASQQGDQVFVYKLDKTSGWSVIKREASVKVVAGDGLGGTYSNGTMTLAVSGAIPSDVTATTQTSTDNSTKIATTAFVNTAIAVDSLKLSVVTVATSGWTAASGIDYTYYKEVAVTGMTTNDFVDISNVGSASSYKNNYAVESLNGKFRIWVASQPTVETTWYVYYKVGMTV